MHSSQTRCIVNGGLLDMVIFKTTDKSHGMNLRIKLVNLRKYVFLHLVGLSFGHVTHGGFDHAYRRHITRGKWR